MCFLFLSFSLGSQMRTLPRTIEEVSRVFERLWYNGVAFDKKRQLYIIAVDMHPLLHTDTGRDNMQLKST